MSAIRANLSYCRYVKAYTQSYRDKLESGKFLRSLDSCYANKKANSIGADQPVRMLICGFAVCIHETFYTIITIILYHLYHYFTISKTAREYILLHVYKTK